MLTAVDHSEASRRPPGRAIIDVTRFHIIALVVILGAGGAVRLTSLSDARHTIQVPVPER